MNDIDHLLTTFTEKDSKLNPDQIYDLGIALRNIGPNFASASLLKVAIDYVDANPGELSHKSVNLEVLSEIIKKHENLNEIINDAGLREVYTLKPMVDGKSIQIMYECKPGKHMKFIIEECLKFQIQNSSATYEQAEQYLMENKEAFLEKYKWNI